MTKIGDRYLEALNLVGRDGVEASKIRKKAALKRAHSIRKFEIDLYWKRSTYFWALQAAIFAAFAVTGGSVGGSTSRLLIGVFNPNATEPGGDQLLVLGLAALGLLTALAGTLSARGSKFWQQNWEKHIDELEDEFEGNLHKTVWVGKGGLGYSVSRVNGILCWCFVSFWILAALTSFATFFARSFPSSSIRFFEQDAIVVMAVIILALTPFAIVMLYCQRTELEGKISDGGEWDTYPHNLRHHCKKARYPKIIRRSAPHESSDHPKE